MNRTEAFARLRASEGKIFSATFVKKDGTTRHMVARIGVSKGVTGKGMAYNPIERMLLPCFDMAKGEFRMVNINTLSEIKLEGETLEVV